MSVDNDFSDLSASEKTDTRTRKPRQVRSARASELDGAAVRPRNAFSGTQTKMSIDPDLLDPNYHYHWFNDEAGRIRSALASGYVFADAEETQFTAGDKNCELGSGAGMVAGRKEDGTVLVARLMKIRRDWWEANQADIQRHCDAVDKEISQGRVANVGPVDSQAFYVPKGHRNTLTRK